MNLRLFSSGDSAAPTLSTDEARPLVQETQKESVPIATQRMATSTSLLRSKACDFGGSVVLTEISDHLVVGNEPAEEPHHLEIAACLTFKPPARLNPVEIAVDVKFRENGRMIGRPAGNGGLHAAKPEFAKIERIPALSVFTQPGSW